ncbi:hypothetical protein TNCV_3990521 [Trichonephila clavipes]|uniref:Uncharacterized protein n=1 Tax=Trichonephila clavipes TaxID=2585209 RepID=A0A8X6VSE5_TRICX|nr:hypothetical protein TNCV_3990521 [Trichonephila clavipes]
MQKIDSGQEWPCRMIIRHVKNPLKCPLEFAAKILKFNFASSELRCLPLKRKNWASKLLAAIGTAYYTVPHSKVIPAPGE